MVGSGGIIRKAVCDGIRQLPAGRYLSGNHICSCIAALLAAMPYIQHGGYGVFIGFR